MKYNEHVHVRQWNKTEQLYDGKIKWQLYDENVKLQIFEIIENGFKITMLYKDKGGSTGVTIGWLVTPLARQLISCYVSFHACDLSYFDIVLCPSWAPRAKSWRQTFKFHSPRKPIPPQCSLASLVRVPKVTPSKNSRSANKRHAVDWPTSYYGIWKLSEY